MSASMSRSRRLFRVVVATSVGCVLALLVAEFAYRISRAPSLSPTTNPSYVERDEELGWRYKPNSTAHHASAEFDVDIRINASGFRGADWPAAADAGETPRVLVLGDSFAFGWGVRDEEVFSARVQSAHPRWQVLNAAVSGYATDQELLLLRRLRPQWKPDVVVCVFCSNDLWESATDFAYGRHKPLFVEGARGLELTGVPVPHLWLEDVSALWRAWMKARSASAFELQPRDRSAEWARVCDLYRAMRDELAGVPLVIVSNERRLAALASAEAGLRHVDLGDMADAREPVLVFEHDGHWNAAGHAFVAAKVDALLSSTLR